MFDTSDLAALPTNISLTLWDALPVLLAVGASIAILAATILPNRYRNQWITWRRLIPIEGVVFLAIFSPSASVLLSLLGLLGLAIANFAPLSRGQARPAVATQSESTPLALVRKHAGEILGQAIGAALALGVYEIILWPSFDLPEIGWALLLGGFVGVLGIAPSAASIVALGFTAGDDVTLAAGIVLAGSVSGQVVSSIRKARQSGVEEAST